MHNTTINLKIIHNKKINTSLSNADKFEQIIIECIYRLKAE